MGVDASSLAFRPPAPTYALLPAAEGVPLRFADGWTPQLGLAQPRSPIRVHAPPLAPGTAAGLRAEVLLLSTGAPALHVTHASGDSAQPRLTLLYSHGTSFDLGLLRDHVAALAAHTGADCLAYDYRGYGAAAQHGPASERAAAEDADAALAWLLSRGVAQRAVVLYGLSLGAAPTMHLAAGAGAGAAGVVLRSGFLSALAVALGRAGAALPGSPFDNAALAARVTAPLLVVHGHRDELVGLWQAQRLAARCAAAVPPLLLPDCGHFDVERSPRFLPRLTRFLAHETRRAPETTT
jgi:pimeloyl-ACP methyl ester carboxylesterase